MKRFACVALALCAPVAYAHHGFGTFDTHEITGTVTDLAFVNPHSWLYLDVTDADGKTLAMKCEMRLATTLRRSGWVPELFPVGGTRCPGVDASARSARVSCGARSHACEDPEPTELLTVRGAGHFNFFDQALLYSPTLARMVGSIGPIDQARALEVTRRYVLASLDTHLKTSQRPDVLITDVEMPGMSGLGRRPATRGRVVERRCRSAHRAPARDPAARYRRRQHGRHRRPPRP